LTVHFAAIEPGLNKNSFICCSYPVVDFPGVSGFAIRLEELPGLFKGHCVTFLRGHYSYFVKTTFAIIVFLFKVAFAWRNVYAGGNVVRLTRTMRYKGAPLSAGRECRVPRGTRE
jgi:hypothetical protein